MNKAIFLDRDGVINEARIENGMAYSPRTIEEFKILPGVKEAIAEFKRHGYLVIVVTNQPEISRGLLKNEDLDKMHSYMKKELAVDDIMVCKHDDEHDCNCRKPKPGMLYAAAEKWEIDLTKSFMIGDRRKDIEAGCFAGCKTILIGTPACRDCEPDFVVRCLLDVSGGCGKG